MNQVSFGNVLKEARERRGMDISVTAARLRIRPDIILAIEEEDFSRLPPRGYTKNMINSYARMVGLNPTDITQMYLDADYAYRAGNARTSAARMSSRATSRTTDMTSNSRSIGRESSSGRVMYDDRKEYRSERGYSTRNNHGHIYAGERPRQSRHTAMNSQYTNFYAGPAANDTNMFRHLPIIIGIVIILILLIIILSMVNCSGNASQPEETPKVPITGIDDTTGVDDSAPAPVEQKIVAPTSVTVTYEVLPGVVEDNTIYAVVNNNGISEQSNMTAPLKEEVQVSGLWSFATWIPDAVSITVDGEPVSFNSNLDDGMPVCVVDFDSWLESWYQKHPDAQRTTDGDSGPTSDSTGSTSATTTDATTADTATVTA